MTYSASTKKIWLSAPTSTNEDIWRQGKGVKSMTCSLRSAWLRWKIYISNNISIKMLSSVRRKKLPADRTWTTSRKSNATYHLTFCLYPCSCRLTLFVLWQQVFWLIWLFRRFVWSWNACRIAWDNWQHWSHPDKPSFDNVYNVDENVKPAYNHVIPAIKSID